MGSNPNQPGDPNARPSFDPNAPFDPTNVNDPRYDPSRDPRYDPRWQKAQQRMWRDQQRMQAGQERAYQRAQAAAWKQQARMQRDQYRAYWRGQRRTSLVGPLLLITIGIVFFLVHTGKIASYSFFNWYAHWWPLLLILIGVLRLAEWAYDRSRQPADAPPMRYTMGGGAILAIILLAAFGLATHAFQWRHDQNGSSFFGFKNNDWMEHFSGQKHEEDAPAVLHEIAANGALNIDNPHGDITVSGTSDDGKVHLSVHKEVYTNDDDQATQRLKELNASLEGTPDSLTLHVPSVQGGGADVTLLVPATTRVLLNSNRGDVHVTNLKSPVNLTANNGDVEVAAITGAVQVHVNNRHHDTSVHSVAGDVTVSGNGDEVTLSDITGAAHISGDFFGGGHMQHITGEVGYHSSRTDLTFAHLYGEFEIDGDDLHAGQVVGPALVSTRSRNIMLDKVTGDVKIVNNHGDVTIAGAPPVGTLTIDNQNGSVNVTMPDKAKFNLQAETSDGDTHADFEGIKSDGRGVLSGQANGGGPQIRINTSHGDITISRNSGTPLMPPPPPPKLGFGAVPAPPTPPMSPDAAEAVRDAQQQVRDAKQQAAEATRDAKQQAAEATRDAKQQAAEAMREAKQAMQEAQQKQRDAERMAREAAKQKE